MDRGHLSTKLKLFVAYASILALYAQFIQSGNAYLGYEAINFTLDYWIILSLTVILLLIFLPTRLRLPSDFFSLFYSIFILAPYGILYSSLGEVPLQVVSVNLAVLVAPLLAIRVLANRLVLLNMPGLVSAPVLRLFLIICMVFGTTYILVMAPKTASFDLASIYIRRLDARGVFTAGSLGAYVQSITVNGLLPLSAFIAGLSRKKLSLLIVFLCAVAFFYVLGLRAQFAMIAIAYLLGLNVMNKSVEKLPNQISTLILLICTISILEWIYFDFSFVADQVIRRLFTVPPFIIAAYMDLMRDVTQGWSLIAGLSAPDGVTYLVGQLYFNDPESNANTNTFVYQLAANGLVGYLAVIILVTVVFVLLNSLYKQKNDPTFLYLGFIFSVLLVEQNATTALVSSGIGFFIIVFSLVRAKSSESGAVISSGGIRHV